MLSPDQIAASGTEHAHQAAAFQWAATVGTKIDPNFSRIFAVPNGASYGGDASERSATGARMKAEGLKSGVPDIFWPYPRPKFDDLKKVPSQNLYWPGLCVELKRPGAHTKKYGDRSEKQIEWHYWLRSQGWPVVTAYGWRAMVRTFLLYRRGMLQTEPGPDSTLLWEGHEWMPELSESQW